MNRIITVGREFGSGGREFGRRLSEVLGVAYYDREIMTEIARRIELSEKLVRSVSEQSPMASFPIHVGRSFYSVPNSLMIPFALRNRHQCEAGLSGSGWCAGSRRDLAAGKRHRQPFHGHA